MYRYKDTVEHYNCCMAELDMACLQTGIPVVGHGQSTNKNAISPGDGPGRQRACNPAFPCHQVAVLRHSGPRNKGVHAPTWYSGTQQAQKAVPTPPCGSDETR